MRQPLPLYNPVLLPPVKIQEEASVDEWVDEDEGAAGGLWCIQTYDRKILKMKKHKRQKRKKKMYTKLKWTGKL